MFKISITKDGVLTNEQIFPTVPQIEGWYDLNQPRFAEGHVKTVTDISSLVIDEQLYAMARKKAEFGREIILMIHVINNKKLASGAVTLQDLITLLDTPLIIKIERLLQHGSIELALGLIQTLPNSYFNGEDLDLITGKIQTFISEL